MADRLLLNPLNLHTCVGWQVHTRLPYEYFFVIMGAAASARVLPVKGLMCAIVFSVCVFGGHFSGCLA